jgi:hypothetical protein
MDEFIAVTIPGIRSEDINLTVHYSMIYFSEGKAWIQFQGTPTPLERDPFFIKEEIARIPK